MKDYVQKTIIRIKESIDRHTKNNDRNQNWHAFFNSLLQGLRKMQENIKNNVDEIPLNDWENKYQSKYNELNKNQPNTSNDDICNDCTNRCLSLCNSCLSLCSCRREQTTETTYQ